MASSLRIVEAAIPSPSASEVLIGVRAIGLNYADVFVCQGVYDAANKALAADPERESFCPGLEFSGVVLQAGDACSAVRAGDRVYGFARFGAYRTAVVVAEKHVRKLPDAWSFGPGCVPLRNGCLVVMGGMCQATHKHELMKVTKQLGESDGRRINLTLRAFKPQPPQRYKYSPS